MKQQWREQWRVINTTRHQVLAENALRATSFTDRLVGLLGKKRLLPGEGLHLLPCDAIHTFFMHIPIDVLFLDEKGQVVRLIPHLSPWRATSRLRQSHSVLELPVGVLVRTGTSLGDCVVFEPRTSLC